ncbi:MAG TPA: hypothetical protein VJQ78_07335 [Sphingobium sp.]|nr:hypothetical protein [Sphingobium sp.]
MELYERELIEAKQKIEEAGKSPDDFRFDMSYQEPEPDGGGMFTVRYDVVTTYLPTGKHCTITGGIGLKWVLELADALEAGYFEG